MFDARRRATTLSKKDDQGYVITHVVQGNARPTRRNFLAWIGRVARTSESTPGDGDCAAVAVQQTRLYNLEAANPTQSHKDILADSQRLCTQTRQSIHDEFHSNDCLRSFLSDDICASALR